VLALLLGGVCIGFAPILVRLSDVGPVASAFWRTALATPVLWLVVMGLDQRSAQRATGSPGAAPASTTPTPASQSARSWSQAVVLSGLFFAADLGTWHFSLQHTTVANATLLANCASLLATLYTVLVLRRMPSPLYFIALALALGGAVALTAPRSDGGVHWRGDLLALVAAVFYTGYMITVKRASRWHDAPRLMAISTTVSTVALAPIAWLLSRAAGQSFWPSGARGWWVLLALALLSQVAGQGLIAWALARLSVALSATGLLVQPMVATVAAWLMFSESLGATQLAGAAVLLAGLWLARRSQA
jgi:drug/metabolite transporter (DMT)-like permease